MKRVFSGLFLVLLLTAFLFSTIPKVKADTKSEVDYYTGIRNGTWMATQRKIFHAQGRYWVFYAIQSTPENLTYKTSVDGELWSNRTFVRVIDSSYGFYFDIWHNSTHIAYASNNYTSSNLYYRIGELETDGSISWVTAEQYVGNGGDDPSYTRPVLTLDSDGYPWVVFRASSSWVNVTKSSTNDGTWTTASSFPRHANTNGFTATAHNIIALTNRKIYVIWAFEGSSAWNGKLWNGTDWYPHPYLEERILNPYSANSPLHSLVSDGDDIYFVGVTDTGYEGTDEEAQVQCSIRNASGWDSGTILAEYGTDEDGYSHCYIAEITVDGSDVFAFWYYDGDTYVSRYRNGEWDTPSVWFSAVQWDNGVGMTTAYESVEDELMYCYTTESDILYFRILDISIYDLKGYWYLTHMMFFIGIAGLSGCVIVPVYAIKKVRENHDYTWLLKAFAYFLVFVALIITWLWS